MADVAPGAVFVGTGVGTRAVAGPVARMGTTPPNPPDVPATGDPDTEKQRALAALAAVAADLRARGAAAGGHTADVLDAQAMMAEDPELADGIAARVQAGKTAARAIHATLGEYREMLAGAPEERARRRAVGQAAGKRGWDGGCHGRGRRRGRGRRVVPHRVPVSGL